MNDIESYAGRSINMMLYGVLSMSFTWLNRICTRGGNIQ